MKPDACAVAEVILELVACGTESEVLSRAGELMRERFGVKIGFETGPEGQLILRDERGALAPDVEALFTAATSSLIAHTRSYAQSRILQDHLRLVVANAPLILYVIDQEERITFVLGSEPFNLSGDNLRPGVKLAETGAPPASVQSVRRALAGHLSTETVERQGRWLEVRRLPLRGRDGEVQAMIGIALDVTERYLAEQRLRENTRLQKAILDGANYAIFSCRMDGTFQTFNRAAENMFGYKAAQVLGKATPLLFLRPDDLKEHWRSLSQRLGHTVSPSFEALATRAREEHSDEFEVEAFRRDGTHFPLRLSITTLVDEREEVAGYVGIGYDLAEVRRVEHLKNEFVSVVSHELRTPLTSIRGALGLLAGGVAGDLPEKAREMIEIAQKNSERLVLLINDILDVEKIESGQMRFEREEVRVVDLVKAAVEANRPYAEQLNTRLKPEIEPACVKLSVEGDEARLMQVLTNLISNAAKYSPSGGEVIIRVRRGENEKAETVRLEIIDEGPGVPPEFLPRLFAKFAQADSSSTRQKGGTGLGLAIAKAIVEKHDGHIGYEAPTPEKPGTTFYLELPLSHGRAPAPAVADNRPTVLICEDDERTARQMAELLDQQGFATEVARTAAKMRNCLQTKQYAGITLDLVLPDADGMEILQELREDPRTSNLPVIVVSVKSHPGGMDGAAMEIVDWLQKPVDPIRLLTAIENFTPNRAEKPRLLHVEDDPDIRQVTRAILGEGVELTEAGTLAQARHAVRHGTFDLVLLDVGLPDGNGMDLVPLLNACSPPVPVILFSARETDLSDSAHVAAALVKSKTTNRQLVDTIQKFQLLHAERRTAENTNSPTERS